VLHRRNLVDRLKDTTDPALRDDYLISIDSAERDVPETISRIPYRTVEVTLSKRM